MTIERSTAQNLSYQSAPSLSGGSYTARKLDRLQLPSLAGKRFLDLGCNMGFYCGHALSQGAARVVGVDVDRAVIVAARQSLPGVEFFDGGWDAFPGGEFDIVICLSAIHYAADPVRLTQDIHRHLAPGGLFVLEGGIAGVGEGARTDLLVPAWRQVGDRCRHLSEPFIRQHLLQGYDWSIKGASELRGGDDIPRYVVHAHRTGTVAPRPQRHTLDLLEYARWLALSAGTIVQGMPSFAYVTALGALGTITSSGLASVLADASAFDTFTADLLFALGGARPLAVELLPTVPGHLLDASSQRLARAGIEVL